MKRIKINGVFFFGWYHCQRVDLDVRLLMQMFQKPYGSGGGKNSQKWQKMAKNDHKREKIFELDEKNDQFANASLILQTRLLSHKIGAL